MPDRYTPLAFGELVIALLSLPNIGSAKIPELIPLTRSADLSYTLPTIAVHENVQPGDPDYPALNPQPTRMVTLKGSLPATLHIRVLISYETAVSATDDSQQLREHCAYATASGNRRAFTVTEPLTVSSSGAELHATIAVDRYLPGRCGWHFDGVGFSVLDGAGPLAEGWFASTYDFHRDQSYLGDLYEGRVDVWCRKQPYPPDPRHPEQCASFASLQMLLSIAPEVVSRIPESERESHPRVWIFPATREVEIHFHDLDAMRASLR